MYFVFLKNWIGKYRTENNSQQTIGSGKDSENGQLNWLPLTNITPRHRSCRQSLLVSVIMSSHIPISCECHMRIVNKASKQWQRLNIPWTWSRYLPGLWVSCSIKKNVCFTSSGMTGQISRGLGARLWFWWVQKHSQVKAYPTVISFSTASLWRALRLPRRRIRNPRHCKTSS